MKTWIRLFENKQVVSWKQVLFFARCYTVAVHTLMMLVLHIPVESSKSDLLILVSHIMIGGQHCVSITSSNFLWSEKFKLEVLRRRDFSDLQFVQISFNVFRSFLAPLSTSQLPHKTYENNLRSSVLQNEACRVVKYYLRHSISAREGILCMSFIWNKNWTLSGF